MVTTAPTDASVAEFLAAVEPARRREDGQALAAMFAEVTGFEPRMWGPSMVGYGAYDYTYKSGQTGTWFATGFSPRKTALSVYIMPGYGNFAPILDQLGKHKTGKSCLYINKLADIDMGVLAQLVRAGLDGLADRWPVRAAP